MKLSFKAQFAGFDVEGYKAALDLELGKTIRDAARSYLEAIVSIIPVWSGASIATFSELASAIQFPLSANPAPNAPTRFSLGKSQGSGELKTVGGVFEFSYSTTLPHLVYNETFNANVFPDSTLFSKLITPGPYEFQDAGENAVLNVFADVDLPDLARFVRVANA